MEEQEGKELGVPAITPSRFPLQSLPSVEDFHFNR
jgi:hypothetical protein